MGKGRFILRMLAVCCGVLLLAGMLSGNSLAEPGSFTLLVYMTGSDLESQGQAASRDLREMAEALPEGGIRLLVQTGGAASWGEGLPADRISRLEILPGRIETAESLPDQSMGEGDTLRDFLQWGTASAF